MRGAGFGIKVGLKRRQLREWWLGPRYDHWVREALEDWIGRKIVS